MKVFLLLPKNNAPGQIISVGGSSLEAHILRGTEINAFIDKHKVVSQSQKLTTSFSLKSQCPTTHPHPPGKFQRSKIELYLQNKSC